MQVESQNFIFFHFENPSDLSPSRSIPRNPFADMCFEPQRCAIFNLSSGQLAPHPPLWRAYFSTLLSHKSLEKPQWIVTFLPFRAPASSSFLLFLLWSSHFCSSPLWLFPPMFFHVSILSEVWLLNLLRLDSHYGSSPVAIIYDP